ncbi:hypothetical protein [Rhizobium leguminosarum]|uniref:hypothetical protein n=1 Tax=Rhizobium leguminosarum TaxID=384 RepID=UPI0010321897|nr:hypothetical protein [Rhizobium leguminosarum]TBF82598.1 hypothetical protein ELG86_10880 [Rhizobium leguminosarum]TBH02083.1 hypothetical protein ELG70_10850 [Rhizobium leguminosarum]TBH36541.1 hypothetical protein ELG66_12180 [Rhizobium leguminosarum]TBH41743.1 hypothetical protein ELG63_10390 [Rhizobium leguminosarum]TBH62298.1 hypothetical protein ELG61_38735 [Rhizobium leguminosarum]
MLFITIGFLFAQIALIAVLRDRENLWVLGLMFGWYCFAMVALIAAIWVHYKKSPSLDRGAGSNHDHSDDKPAEWAQPFLPRTREAR